MNKWCRDSRIVTNNNTICFNRRGLKKDSAGLGTPTCNELRRRRFYSLTPESEGAERIRAERNRQFCGSNLKDWSDSDPVRNILDPNPFDDNNRDGEF